MCRKISVPEKFDRTIDDNVTSMQTRFSQRRFLGISRCLRARESSTSERTVSVCISFLELTRRQEDLRRLDELRSQDFDRRRLAPSSMHLADTYNGPLGNAFASNQNVGGYPYNNDFSQAAYPNPLMQQTGSPAFNQGAHGFASPGDSNAFAHGNGYNHPAQDFERKRSRYH